MQDVNRLSKLLLKSCTQAVILLLKFVMFQVFETVTRSVTSPLYSSLAILQIQQLRQRLFPISSFSETTCITISSARKRICILGWGIVYLSSRRFWTEPRWREQLLKGKLQGVFLFRENDLPPFFFFFSLTDALIGFSGRTMASR